MTKSILLAALGLAAVSASSTPGGMLARIDKDGQMDTPCPLEHTAVTAEAQGPVARVRVRQIFRNPTGKSAADMGVADTGGADTGGADRGRADRGAANRDEATRAGRAVIAASSGRAIVTG
jgi:hypothetical protein